MKKGCIRLLFICCATLLIAGCATVPYIQCDETYSVSSPGEVTFNASVAEKSPVYVHSSVDSGDVTCFAFEYRNILRRIWIADNWIENQQALLSFRLDRANDGYLFGEIVKVNIAFPPTFRENDDFQTFTSNLILSYNDGFFKGSFSVVFEDHLGNIQESLSGNILLSPSVDGKLGVTIEYTYQRDATYSELKDGFFFYRPLNIYDIQEFIENEDMSFSSYLNSWGYVQIIIGHYRAGRLMPFPAIFLTDCQGSILYYFRAPYQIGTFPCSVTLMDVNENGLIDVIVKTTDTIDCIYSVLTLCFRWIFFQLENGWFYMVRGDLQLCDRNF